MNMAELRDFRGELRYHEPMSRHCSWRAGGCADVYFEPADRDDLAEYLASQDAATPITWLGLGSNLLVRDGGLRGVVISVLNRLNGLQLLDDGRVYAECGVTDARLARFCHKQQLADADFLAGIPGTVGGALAMNAGAFGFDTWRFVEAVDMMNRQGQIVQRARDEFEVGYRHVVMPEDEWFVAAYFCFPASDVSQVSNIKPLLARRNASQPIGLPSCGSVFRNPPGDYAARLIEGCGLKGFCIGGACVSDKHANFIINTGDATASEIETLMQQVRRRVQENYGVRLIEEVRILGDRS